MDKLIAYNCKSEFFTAYPVDISYIINNINSLAFNSILLDPKLEIEEGLLLFTEEARPLSIGYDYVFKNYFGINGEYFKKNKETIHNVLITVCEEIKTIYLHIDRELITDEIEKILIDNKEIKELVIGNIKIR